MYKYAYYTHKDIHEKQLLNKILKLLTIVLNKVIISVLLISWWYLSSILAKEANDPDPQFPGMPQMLPASFHYKQRRELQNLKSATCFSLRALVLQNNLKFRYTSIFTLNFLGSSNQSNILPPQTHLHGNVH